MKAILVVDLSKDVLIPTKDIDLDKCEIHYVIQDCYGNPIKAEVDGVKLKPMPKRKTVGKIKEVDDFMKSDIQIINDKVAAEIRLDTELLLASGYNLCVDELLGEK